jgi:4-amino-4-deoxy-L-arabinose transferase-like glycosyltransferase
MMSIQLFICKTFEIIKHNISIIVLLLVAFVLRLWGIGIGLPTADLVGDETFSISYILRVFATGNPFTQNVNPYPIMLTIMHTPLVIAHLAFLWVWNGFNSVAELQTYLLVHGVSGLLFWPRIVSVFAGTATIFLVYRTLGLVFSRRAAFFGALAATVSILPVSISHWGRAHSVLAFFIVASAYYALLCETRNSIKYFYLSVVASAAAFSTHYLGVSALIFPFLALLHIKSSWSQIARAVVLFLVIVVPAYAFNITGIIIMVRGTYQDYYLTNRFAGLSPIGPLERFYYVIRDLFDLDPVGVTVGSIGVLLLFIRKKITRPIVMLLIGMGFIYIVQIVVVAARHQTRWLLPFDLFLLGVGVASFVDIVLLDYVKGTRWKTFVMIIVLLPGFVITLKWLLLLGTHTQVQVEQWMNEHRSESMFLYSEYVNPLPTVGAATWNAEHNQRLRNSAKNAYVVAHPERFLSVGISYYHATDMPEGDHCSIIHSVRARYIILSYTTTQEREQQTAHIKNCISGEPIVRYSPGSDELHRLPFENLVNSISSYRFILSSAAIGPWFEVYSVSGAE